MRTLRISFAALLVFGLAACDTDSGDNVTQYTVDLNELNSSGVTGTALITVDTDAGSVSIDLDASGLDATIHPQHIHARPNEISVCPTSAADTNGDTFVDVLEGLPSYGGILLPLDNDISNQDTNLDGFPNGATIDYSTSAPLADLRAALLRTDPDDSDAVVTLGAGTFISFDDFVIVVHGTTDALPGTVQTLPGLSASATLPVACGVIRAL